MNQIRGQLYLCAKAARHLAVLTSARRLRAATPIVLALALALACCGTTLAQSTANWTGASGGEWNTAANWDIGVPGFGTNAVTPASPTVNYNLPMAAPRFRSLTL